MKKQWDEFWKGISTTDAELNKFLQEGGLSSLSAGKIKKFVESWNKLKDQASRIDEFITPVKPIQVRMTFTTPAFTEMWERWKTYLKEQHGEIMFTASEQSALEYLAHISKNNEELAMSYLRFAMTGRYRNFFKVDEKSTTQPMPEPGTKKGSDFG